VTKRQDRNGRAITFAWTTSTSHDIATVTDSQGRVTTVTHDVDGQITQIVDSANRTYTYTYGTAGGWGKTLRSYTDPAGGVTQYDYEPAYPRLSSVITPGGSETRLTYYPDSDPRAGLVASVTRVTDPSAGTEDVPLVVELRDGGP
jgi:YD repeat-containing protein